ncbi:MAG: hypothetical protein R2939_12965 [Kofleriaceae bacterium]
MPCALSVAIALSPSLPPPPRPAPWWCCRAMVVSEQVDVDGDGASDEIALLADGHLSIRLSAASAPSSIALGGGVRAGAPIALGGTGRNRGSR